MEIFLFMYSGLSNEKAKHPSALEVFERMIAAAKGKKIVVFLDYDGTLSPIVEDPNKAVMSDAVSLFLQPYIYICMYIHLCTETKLA